MSYMPRLRLTPYEKQFSEKYYDPTKLGMGVKRRMYPAHLELTAIQRTPLAQFQISRYCRVFALTAAGDIEQFKVEISTNAGELHTQGPVELSMLLGGYSQSPLGLFPTLLAQPPNAGWTSNAYVFEPSLILLPNETLAVRGSQIDDFLATNFRVDMVLHVWEFPGIPGSPL